MEFGQLQSLRFFGQIKTKSLAENTGRAFAFHQTVRFGGVLLAMKVPIYQFHHLISARQKRSVRILIVKMEF